ncbi:NAD(P)H-dependent oxidoreductase [Halobacillus sp. A1]|uniref:NADPH-dependent FMN reductase n=1 Tax=Halobacillus sp. A1 TaxID=2880262 RepID=UPI0020A631B5|nr:NADPH-dependent FMN reductase [Halobacillus sp. A1]MCP3031587.1 NAD(P)H-dependent oxidoreductase [Halobacillus sp. A1]
MNLLIISGTPRKKGRTRKVAYTLLSRLQADVIDLSDLALPLFNGEAEQDRVPEVQWLREMSNDADAFIWISPEYHNGMSGVLKNALDFLNNDHFSHKPTLLMSVSGGGKGGINSINQMRLVGRGLHAMVVPDQLIFDPDSFKEDGAFTADIERRVTQVLHEFTQYAELNPTLGVRG